MEKEIVFSVFMIKLLFMIKYHLFPLKTKFCLWKFFEITKYYLKEKGRSILEKNLKMPL